MHRLSKLSMGLALLVVAAPLGAKAERGEATVGLQGGLLLPAFSPTSNTAFTLATWTGGVTGSYGILDDLSVTATFSFSTFDGDAEGYTLVENGIEYTGTLRSATRFYYPQIGLKYKLYAGYDLAPYVEASIGYAWTTFHHAQLVNDEGLIYDTHIPDFAEGAFTLSIGVSADYRLFNLVFVGVGFFFTYLTGEGLLERFFSLPITATYYW